MSVDVLNVDIALIPSHRSGGYLATTDDGKLWLVGGQSDNGVLSDVWSYEPSSGIWTFEAGSQPEVSPAQAVFGQFRIPSINNLMPSRTGFSAAMDRHAGVIFIHGGTANNGASLADMWSFNVTNKLFAWIGGQPGANGVRGSYPALQGIYGGEVRASRPNNQGGNMWVDPSGGLWFGMGRYYNYQLDQNIQCNGAISHKHKHKHASK